MEHRTNFTTIAVEKDVARMLKACKIHPRQSDNEVLKEILVGRKPSKGRRKNHNNKYPF